MCGRLLSASHRAHDGEIDKDRNTVVKDLPKESI